MKLDLKIKYGRSDRMEIIDKEVYFGLYCAKCKDYLTDEAEEPCNDCLNYPVNENSHKPIHWSNASK